jgi:hypothetical protein
MGGTIEFLVKYGDIVVFFGVVAEQIGLRLPSATRLSAAGALAGLRRLNVFRGAHTGGRGLGYPAVGSSGSINRFAA